MFASRPVALVSIFLLFLQCTTESERPTSPPGTSKNPAINGQITGVFDGNADINILFVGNSLTYENDLPSLVREIANMDGVRLGVTSIVAGNYSLDDHWQEGTIQSTLEKTKYDLLIAQQGPSALPESQIQLRESSVTIANECRAHNTMFGLYMVWPALARDFDRDNSIASYTNAANAAGGLLCPAGLAWKLAWKQDGTIPFYGPDNFHPGIHGSVLAAMSIYVTIKEKKDLNFINKSAASWSGSISDAQLEIMKAASLEANRIK